MLAVVGDVEPDRQLPADHVLHRGPHAGLERRRVPRRPFLVLPEEGEEVVGSREAPGPDHLPRTFPQSVIFPLNSVQAGYFMNSSGVQVQN